MKTMTINFTYPDGSTRTFTEADLKMLIAEKRAA